MSVLDVMASLPALSSGGHVDGLGSPEAWLTYARSILEMEPLHMSLTTTFDDYACIIPPTVKIVSTLEKCVHVSRYIQ